MDSKTIIQISQALNSLTKNLILLSNLIEKEAEKKYMDQLPEIDFGFETAKVPIKLQVINKSLPTHIPKKGSEYAAAYDLRAVFEGERITINPNTCVLVPTNLRVECPIGIQLNIYSRSGLARNKIFVANQPGIIDPDYRGELGVLLLNLSDEPFVVNQGDRIAQCQINPILNPRFILTEMVSLTKRGDGGFGSSGIK